MKFMSPRAVAATVLLHAGLIAAVLHLSDDRSLHTSATPLEVQIVPAAEPPATTTPEPAITPTAPTSTPPIKRRPQAKPRTEAKPDTEARSRQKPVESIPPPAAAPEAKPSFPVSTPPSPPTTEPAARAERNVPVKTGASEAAYAASNRKPPYPRLSRSNNEQGTVVLRVLVKADGTAGQVEIKASSGYPLLDKSASQTVQAWRFNPATVNGKAVDEWYEVPIPFKLVDD